MGRGIVRRRVSHACLPAIVVALLTASSAPAATLSVDDDRRDCTAAGYTSIQDAVDAAAPGDTVVICPGHYSEGNGDPNTNALTVDKTLTIKGAGADLVTISPVRYDGNDGVIAEDARDPDNPTIPAQSIRHPKGNILTAVGSPAVPITVNVSGVSFDGDGVAAKAGVVFLDAQGSLVRSRVTDVVTSEMPGAYELPGGYRAEHYLGYGVAQVSAFTIGAGPRTLTLDNVRVDEYNRIGVLIDGGRSQSDPTAGPGIDMRGTIVSSSIVGRNLCPDAHVDGDCGRFNPPSNPDPKPLTTGPLMGQDGVQIAGGARAAIRGSSVTQNLVQGENSPVRGTATNNNNLPLGAGIRFIGADAANSSVKRSNVTDNAYGIINVNQDGTDATTALDAAGTTNTSDANWWGLRSGPGNPPPANTGPAVSPTSNPPYPENPVNGAPAPDGAGITSTTVDFWPYRSGPQGDPNNGQNAIAFAPMPVDDAAPSVTVRPERRSYSRGETVKLIAEPSDDFGIRRVTFFDGATEVGSDDSPPYEAAFTIPANASCGPRDVAATAEDSLGQTATGTGQLTVNCAGQPPGQGAAPTVQLPQNLQVIRRGGETVTVNPAAENGVDRVEFFLGARRVCRDTEAPYSCVIKPYSTEIGSQTLRVVVTDKAGLTGQDSRQVQVPRFSPKELKLKVSRKKLDGGRVRRTVTAAVIPPTGVKRAAACSDARMTTLVKRGSTTLVNRESEVDERCRAVVLRLTTRRGKSRGLRYKTTVRFGGSTVLATAKKTRRFR
jgi:hypothetical protein